MRLYPLLKFLITFSLMANVAYAVDTDGDGLEDDWETTSFGDLTHDGEEDTDADGYPNHWEHAHGTDGADANSKPQWAATQTGPGYYRVDGNLAANTDYEKQTLSEAIAAAANFSVIEILPGSYAGPVTIPSSKRLVVFSTAGAVATDVVATGSGALALRVDSGSVIDGLTVRSTGSSGIALYVFRTSLSKIRNCVFTDSTTGVYLYSDTTAAYRCEIDHCTITGNVNGFTSNRWRSAARCDIRNSVISGNSTRDIYTVINLVDYNQIYISDSALGHIVSSSIPALGSNVLRIDPAADGSDPNIVADAGLTPNLHLQSTSPLVDRGAVLPLSNVNSVDMDGETRTGTLDLGADEFIDGDSDGLPDWWEVAYPADADPADDSDNDGANALAEYNASTDPLDADTDDDALVDGWELANNYDPLSTDGEEDTDADGYPNLWEHAHGTDGTDPNSKPQWAATQTGPGYYRVDGNLAASTDYEKQTLSEAIAAAVNYSVIEILPGSYAGPVTIPSSKRLVVFSTAGAAATEVLATGSGALALRVNSSSVIDGLTVRSTGSSGIALHVFRTSLSKIRNCVFTDSTTGVYLYSDATAAYRCEIDHCTITGNVNGFTSNRWRSAARCDIRNSVISGNSTRDIYTVINLVDYNQIYISDSALGHIVSSSIPALGSNVLRIDPAADGSDPNIVADAGLTPNLHLQSTSPLVDRGAVLPLFNVNSVDMDGETRTGIPDLGADEFIDGDSDGLPDWWEVLTPPMQIPRTTVTAMAPTPWPSTTRAPIRSMPIPTTTP